MALARGASSWLTTALLATLLGVGIWNRTGSRVALVAGILAGASFLFFLQFFRDPQRTIADGIASAADGRVSRIDVVQDAEFGTCDRLAVFMSPIDVHVNRFPIAGQVVSVTHIAGGHIPAFNKDSDVNERVVTILDTPLGRVKVVQIAGTVARRIVPYIAAGHPAKKGERMGLIRLGSRCDVYIPRGKVRWLVQLKQQVYAGKTQIAEVVA